eukprot:g10769.t1
MCAARRVHVRRRFVQPGRGRNRRWSACLEIGQSEKCADSSQAVELLGGGAANSAWQIAGFGAAHCCAGPGTATDHRHRSGGVCFSSRKRILMIFSISCTQLMLVLLLIFRLMLMLLLVLMLVVPVLGAAVGVMSMSLVNTAKSLAAVFGPFSHKPHSLLFFTNVVDGGDGREPAAEQACCVKRLLFRSGFFRSGFFRRGICLVTGDHAGSGTHQ